ncbi:hypothetical protein ACEPAI_2939 [Sanghuangporus weigelae]
MASTTTAYAPSSSPPSSSSACSSFEKLKSADITVAEKECDSQSVTVDDQHPVSSSSVEKGYASNDWEDYKDDSLPDKTNDRYLRNLRFQIFVIYRRLFGVVFITNMAVFITTAIKGDFNAMTLGQIVIANIFVSVLIRLEHVVNILFAIFCSVPPSWPLWIRCFAARIYSLGGIHSGCAVSATIWLVFFAAQATHEKITGGKTSVATVTITYIILLLLLTMIGFAYPKVRSVAHDRFERTHRFMGWTAVGLVWALIVLLTNDYREPSQSLGRALTLSPPFWLVVVLTLSIIAPWTHLRKHTVDSQALSEHALRINFNYGTYAVPGSFIRISDSPLLEWHSFATMAEPNKPGQYSVIISRAGDWTRRMIENPPKEIWVRGVPTCGVMRIAPMFRRLVLVATGSGIAPIAPHVLARMMPIRLLWVSMTVRETFGDALVDALLEAEPGAVLYDTRKHGRPDMVKLAHRMYKDFDAEAVCIISNQKLTQKVVYGLMSRGIPAFGAIWDS